MAEAELKIVLNIDEDKLREIVEDAIRRLGIIKDLGEE